jgi:hypothetical protein
MSDDPVPYCGIKDVPKGRKRGTMKECAERNEIRYFGLNKVDSKVMESSKDVKKATASRTSLLKKLGGLSGEVKKLDGDVKYGRTEEVKSEAKKLMKDKKAELLDVAVELRNMEKAPKSVSKKEKASKKANRWMEHVKSFRLKNPALSYKEVLVEAKKSYIKN